MGETLVSLLQLAREASGDLHRQIEKTDLAASMAQGRVDRATYARLMGAMVQIHDTVENRLQEAPLAAINGPSFHRYENALADYKVLSSITTEENFEALADWKTAFDFHPSSSPWLWVGALYVLEGSRMGSRMLLGQIASALGVPVEPGRGVDYHLFAVADKGQSWATYKAFLEKAQLEDDDREAFAAGVRLTFQMMLDLYRELSSESVAVHA
jgi:heme oxygenase